MESKLQAAQLKIEIIKELWRREGRSEAEINKLIAGASQEAKDIVEQVTEIFIRQLRNNTAVRSRRG